MALKTDAELLAEAQVIRDETTTDENTATRVGGHMVNGADSKINKQVNIYPLSGGFVPGSYIPIWNDTVGRVESIPAETLQGSTDVSIYEYDNVTNYVVDEVVTHLGLWYQALAINGPGSTIVEPGTNGAVWDEISKALPGVLPWEAGAYIEDEVFVLAQVAGVWGLYHLIDAARPYMSTDFDTELAALDWEIIGGESVPDASATVKGIVELATPAEIITGTDTVRAVTAEGVHGKVVGVQDLFYPAGGIRPRNTNGCSVSTQIEMATSLVNLVVLAFDQTTQEFAQFDIVPPRKYNNGTITATPVWTAQSGSGTVQWGVSFGSYRNDDALTGALGTAQTSDDTLLAANDFHEGPDTSAITPAGTIQDGNFLVCQISRNPANDTLNADALLIGLWLHFTTDAAKDA